jgi:hypothetical protein
MKYLRHRNSNYNTSNIIKYIYIKTGNEPHILCKDEDMLT